MRATTIGIDLAKSSFQVHGVDAHGKVALRKQLRRGKLLEFFANLPCCRVGIEACGGAHYWARELTKLGHEVRLMPPQYVKPYVKTNKHDAADAEGCCEAVQRPSMRFVPVKSETQQALLMLHRIRDRLIAERTGTINAIRGHMAEFGIVAARRGLRHEGAASDHLGRRGRASANDGPRAPGAAGRAPPSDRDEDRRPRSGACSCQATQQRGRQAADGDPGHWPRDRHGNGGDGRQRADLPQWPQLCRVARSHAAPIHDWWPGTAARHQQAR